MDTVLLSTVTPVYRGAGHLRRLVDELATVRGELAGDGWPVELVEAIFVDDGSSDGSSELLAELAAETSWLRVVQLARNFGQHQATVAGILHSSGDWVATLDEDLQHRPRDLPALLAAAVEGRRDIVYGEPRGRVHDSWLRDLPSRWVKGLLGALTGNRHVRRFSSFRMIRGTVARGAAAVAPFDTYFDFVLGWFTDRVGSLPLEMRDERFNRAGESGYSIPRLVSHARRMFLSTQLRALRFGGAIGLLALVLSGIGALVVLGQRLLAPETIGLPGWASLLLVILFFGGLTSFLLGILLEFMNTVILQVKGRPPFFVVDRSRDESLRRALARRSGGARG